MIFKLQLELEWKQWSPSGGPGSLIEKIEIWVVEDEKDLEQRINKFLNNDYCGYRKFMEIKDIQRV